MKRKIRNIVVRSLGLFVATTPTWDKIATEKLTENEIQKQYIFPWIAICVTMVFLFEGLYASQKALETGFIKAIITAVSFLGSYFLSNKICFWYLRKQQPEFNSALDSAKIVSYSFTTMFVLKVFTTVLPSLFFLQILSVFTAYLVWEGCRAVLKLNEEERGNIVLVFTSVIIFLPIIISQIIHWMLPNV
jgi:hypothetical protein